MFDFQGDDITPDPQFATSIVSISKADLLATVLTVDNATLFLNLDPNVQTNPFTTMQPALDFGPSDGRAALLSQAGIILRTDILNVAGPNPATLSDRISIPTDFGSNPRDAVQPGGGALIETGASFLRSTVFEQGDSFWVVRGEDVNDRAGIGWFEIDETTNEVLQSGTIGDPELDLFYPSIAVNPFGDVVIGFSGSSEDQFASAYVVVGNTVGGVTNFGLITLIKAGQGTFLADLRGPVAWGDYSATVLDPSDPFSFWTFQEFVVTQDVWGVQIAQVSVEVITSCPDDVLSEIPTLECEALVALFNSTDGPNWTNNSEWLETDTPCSWSGVTCDADHVTRLDLADNLLNGSIPAELGSLSNLTVLRLDRNELSGSIPAELGGLSNLTKLVLHNNQLSGSIPVELGNLSNLTDLELDHNELSGPLPQNLTNLNLTGFHFNDTALCEPPDASFQAWLASIDDLQSTGVVCITTPCTLTVGLGYADGILTMDFEIGTLEPVLWGTWMVVPGIGIAGQWYVPLPAIDPSRPFPISIPGVPSIGIIGFLTALITSEGVICSDWNTVDTGAPSSNTPSPEELYELFRRVNTNQVLSGE